MLDTIMSLMGTGGFGAIIGGACGIVTKWQDSRQRKIDNDHKAAMRALDLQELALEHQQQVLMVDKNIDLAEAEGNVAIDLKEAEGFVASLTDGGSKMDAAKSWVRPLLTVISVGYAFWIHFVIGRLVGGVTSLPVAELMTLYSYTTHQIIFLAVMAFSWWFAARGVSLRSTPRAVRSGD
jgi:hypothetical protein